MVSEKIATVKFENGACRHLTLNGENLDNRFFFIKNKISCPFIKIMNLTTNTFHFFIHFMKNEYEVGFLIPNNLERTNTKAKSPAKITCHIIQPNNFIFRFYMEKYLLANLPGGPHSLNFVNEIVEILASM